MPNLRLKNRNEGTRESLKTKPVFTSFSLKEIKNYFDTDYSAIVKMTTLATELENEGRKTEAEQIRRSQIMFVESTLDFFLHEIGKYGILAIFEGRWKETEKYKRFSIPIRFFSNKYRECSKNNEWLLEAANEIFSSGCYLGYDSMADHLNLVGISLKNILKKYYSVNDPEGRAPSQVVNDIYRRRNIIAHQSDRKHYDAKHLSISETEVTQTLKDIKQIVELIYNEAVTNEESALEERME